MAFARVGTIGKVMCPEASSLEMRCHSVFSILINDSIQVPGYLLGCLSAT